ncbi:MAG: response regulator [Candidatus Cybelea sp.]
MARVLVVDDAPDTRLLVRTLLTHVGHEVFEAADGAVALSSATEHRPDLVLLDFSMPAMSGPEFIRALRADPRAMRTVVALYTATAMNPALRDFMQMYGIEHVIPKPSEPLELLAAVERALAS